MPSVEFWVCAVVCRRASDYWRDSATNAPVDGPTSKRYVARIQAGDWIYLDGRVMEPVSDHDTNEGALVEAQRLHATTGREYYVVLNADLTVGKLGKHRT